MKKCTIPVAKVKIVWYGFAQHNFNLSLFSIPKVRQMSKTSFQGIQFPVQFPVSYEIEAFPTPKEVVISMCQQPGQVCEPLVQKGDQVKKGQLIASGLASEAAPIHASVSGTVKDIRSHLEPKGRTVTAVFIESDGAEEWADHVQPGEMLPMIGSVRLLTAIRGAGIVQAGAPSFSLGEQLTSPVTAQEAAGGGAAYEAPKLLVINGMDIEPGVSVRNAVLRSKIDEVVQGIKILRQVAAVRNVVLVINDERVLTPKGHRLLVKDDIDIFWGSSKYPSALEPMLIKQITGREIPLPGGSSRDVGVMTLDVLSVLNVLDAAKDNKPQIEKLITVSAPGMEGPRNILVPIGTRVSEIVETLNLGSEVSKVIIGGLMMGDAQYSLDIPITKQNYAIILQPESELSEFLPEPCINCGACPKVCPTNLMPNMLSRYCEYNKFEEAERNFIFHCIECGNCAYICPTKRPMVHFMRLGKKELLAKRTGA